MMRSPSSASSYCCPRALDVLATDQSLPSLLLVLPLSQLSCAGDANALRDHLHPPPRLPNRQDHARPLLARLLAQHAARRFYAPCSATHPCIARFHAAGGDARCKLQAVSLYLYTRALINSDVLRAHEHFALLFLLYAYNFIKSAYA